MTTNQNSNPMGIRNEQDIRSIEERLLQLGHRVRKDRELRKKVGALANVNARETPNYLNNDEYGGDEDYLNSLPDIQINTVMIESHSEHPNAFKREGRQKDRKKSIPEKLRQYQAELKRRRTSEGPYDAVHHRKQYDQPRRDTHGEVGQNQQSKHENMPRRKHEEYGRDSELENEWENQGELHDPYDNEENRNSRHRPDNDVFHDKHEVPHDHDAVELRSNLRQRGYKDPPSFLVVSAFGLFLFLAFFAIKKISKQRARSYQSIE